MALSVVMEGMRITKEESFASNPRNINNIDIGHMYTDIGTNVVIFYSNFKDEEHDYIIIANPKTGKRIKIELETEDKPEIELSKEVPY